MRLNKYLSHSGFGSRRETTEAIKKGAVTVDGNKIIDPAFEVIEGAEVKCHGKLASPQIKHAYWVINKASKVPLSSADHISMEKILKTKSGKELRSIGDISDESCGLVIMTDDPKLIEIYTNNLHTAKSQFTVTLSDPVAKNTLETIKSNEESYHPYGIVNLIITSDNLETTDRITIETIGVRDTEIYTFLADNKLQFAKVDREWFNGITKKDLKRGWSRQLTEKEKIFLLHFAPKASSNL